VLLSCSFLTAVEDSDGPIDLAALNQTFEQVSFFGADIL
jgi:hypothetical protein